MPRKNGTPKVCERCGQPFVAMDERANRPTRYCSRACGQPNQKNRTQLTCRQCGTSFERKRYMADWSQERGPFCSFRCYGQWQQDHMQGEANPNFRPQSPRRGSGQWERARREALERDNYQCQGCGATNEIYDATWPKFEREWRAVR